MHTHPHMEATANSHPSAHLLKFKILGFKRPENSQFLRFSSAFGTFLRFFFFCSEGSATLAPCLCESDLVLLSMALRRAVFPSLPEGSSAHRVSSDGERRRAARVSRERRNQGCGWRRREREGGGGSGKMSRREDPESVDQNIVRFSTLWIT